MSCSSYKTSISRYLDDALDEAERRRLLAHIRTCSQCAAALASYRSMDGVLRRSAGVHARPFSHTPMSNSPLPYPAMPVWQSPATALGLVSVGAIIAVLAVFLSGALVLFLSKMPNPLTAPSAVTVTEASPRSAADDTGGRLKLYNSSDAVPVRSTSRPAVDDALARSNRSVTLGYRPAGRSDGVPVYSGPSNDLAMIYATLGDGIAGPSAPLSLSGSLPPGALIERVMLEKAMAPSQTYYLEITFAVPSGNHYRLQEITADGTAINLPAMTDEGTLLVSGRAWKYGRTGQRAPTGETPRILRSTAGNRITTLETNASLDEMVQVLQYMR